MTDDKADNAGVKQALAQLLAWPEIARSPQLANFLSYIVERRLSGDAQSIKAYSIAVDVFGRAPDFDPQADPIVRVQARRLRGLLEQYYLGPGADDPLRIELPIGRYVPEFVAAGAEPVAQAIGRDPPVVSGTPPKEPRRGHITLSWFVLLVLTLGAVAATYALATWPRRDQQVVAAASSAIDMPRLRIMDFQNLTGESSLTPSIAALTVELVTDFEPLLIVDVAFGARSQAAAPPDDFVLSGVVRKDNAGTGGYHFNAILTDAATNMVVWNWAATIPSDGIGDRAGIEFVSQELILRLGGPRGPLHDRARDMLARNDIAGEENFYLCGLLFVVYRTAPNPGTAARADTCLTALAEKNGDGSGNALAAQASLLAETPLDGTLNEEEQEERYEQAQAMLSQALSLSQTSSFVWEQQARLHEARGNHDMALAAYGTALQLNAANIDATAAYARHLALSGRLDLAVPLARRAISSIPTLEVPDWFQCVPALAALRDGSTVLAKRLAQDCARVDTELGPILALLSARSEGDTAGVGQALPRILETPTFRASGIMSRLETRIADETLLKDVRQALLEADVPGKNLDSAY